MLLFCVPGTTLKSNSSLFADRAAKNPRVRDPHRLSSTQFSGEALLELLLSMNEIKQL